MAILNNNEHKIKSANGELTSIEHVKPGDWLWNKNGFPEHVRGVRTFIYRTGYTKAISINKKITCNDEQFFVGADGFYYILDGSANLNYQTFKKSPYSYVTYNYVRISRMFAGIPDHLIKPLQVGVELLTEDGTEKVTTIDELKLDEVLLESKKDFFEDHYKKNLEDISVSDLSIDDFCKKLNLFKVIVSAYTSTAIVNGFVIITTPNNAWDFTNDCHLQPDEFEIIINDKGESEKILYK